MFTGNDWVEDNEDDVGDGGVACLMNDGGVMATAITMRKGEVGFYEGEGGGEIHW